MKKRRILILSIILIVNNAVAVPKLVDKIVAIVNKNIILESDINEMIFSIKTQAQQTGSWISDDRTMRNQIIERLVMDSIVLQIGKQIGAEVSEKILDQTIYNIAKQNHLTLHQMKKYLSNNGINYNAYREQIRKEMLITAVQNSEVRRRIIILPQETETLVKQIASKNNLVTELNIMHIFLPISEDTAQQSIDAQEKIMNKLVSELRKGINLDRLTITYSSNLQTLKIDNMGWIKIEELPTLFFSNFRAPITKGDFIGPIRSDIGFHVLKINDIRRNQHTSLAEVNLRHILLKPSTILTDNQVYQKLIQITNDIKSKKISFSDAARKFSEDPRSANQGGDLGWYFSENLDPVFRESLLNLKKGDISQPIHSSFGWSIIQLLDIRKIDKTNAIQNEQAYHLLFNRKFSEEMQNWMQDQRSRFYVKIFNVND